MAKFNVVGLEEVEKKLLQRAKATEEAVPEMLKAGAAVLVKAQQDEIESMEIVDFRDMKNSVKATKIKGNDTERYIEVYPHGKDRKGVSNATKGFIAQYGKSNEPARPWMTVANEKCANEVRAAMLEVWEEKQNG